MRSFLVATAPLAVALLAVCSVECTDSSVASSPDSDATLPNDDAGPPADGDVDAGPPTPSPYGLDTRPSNTTCLAPDRPANGIKLTRAFPNLHFDLPVYMLQAPGDSSKWYVVEQGLDDGPPGAVKVFDNVPNAESTRDFVRFAPNEIASGSPSNEGGLLGFTFHPDYANNRTAFLSYTKHSSASPVDMTSVVTRIKRKSSVNELDRGTEEVLVREGDGRRFDYPQPALEHKNGTIAFGRDGMLYMGFGDGGEDDGAKGQDTASLFSKILRIDVGPTGPYKIPADNPWVQNPSAGSFKETWAHGFRNPWRFSFDRGTGELWAGDVGDDRYEEINKIEKGGNYGWRIREGMHCTGRYQPCPRPGLVDPVVEYTHDHSDRGIIGGFVYRGSKIPFLVGSYLFADLSSGRISRAVKDPNTGAYSIEELAMAGFIVSSFGEGLDGELYVTDYSEGQIFRIDPVVPGSSGRPLAQTLSATGCVNPQNPKQPAAGMIPYDVNAALWSDAAGKRRWLAVPDGTTIRVKTDGDWDFPIGTVLMKEFALGGKLIETRLFVRHQDGDWAGYTYEWNDAQTDATLVPTIKTKPVGSPEQPWTIPGRTYCMQCHTKAAGHSLGLENGQLNGDMVYPSTNRISNQLATINHIGLLDPPLGNPSSIVRYAKLESSESLDLRARAYLHGNCAGCHQPGGGAMGPMDFRFATPFATAGICNAEPWGWDLEVPGARILVPGDPAKSILSLRMRSTNPGIRMPPLASHVVHAEATQLIEDWIRSMNRCP